MRYGAGNLGLETVEDGWVRPEGRSPGKEMSEWRSIASSRRALSYL